MRKLIFLSLVFIVASLCSVKAKDSGYTANDNLIDEMFAVAPEAVNVTFSDLTLTGNSTSSLAS